MASHVEGNLIHDPSKHCQKGNLARQVIRFTPPFLVAKASAFGDLYAATPDGNVKVASYAPHDGPESVLWSLNPMQCQKALRRSWRNAEQCFPLNFVNVQEEGLPSPLSPLPPINETSKAKIPTTRKHRLVRGSSLRLDASWRVWSM